MPDLNPVTVQMLRDAWADDPELAEGERDALNNLSDQKLQAALDKAYKPYIDVWTYMRDEVLGRAKKALLGARKGKP